MSDEFWSFFLGKISLKEICEAELFVNILFGLVNFLAWRLKKVLLMRKLCTLPYLLKYSNIFPAVKCTLANNEVAMKLVWKTKQITCLQHQRTIFMSDNETWSCLFWLLIVFCYLSMKIMSQCAYWKHGHTKSQLKYRVTKRMGLCPCKKEKIQIHHSWAKSDIEDKKERDG